MKVRCLCGAIDCPLCDPWGCAAETNGEHFMEKGYLPELDERPDPEG